MKPVGDDPAGPGPQPLRPDLQRWNERFSTEHYLFGTERNAFLAAQGHLLKPGQKALAVADGEGRNGAWLAAQGLDVLSIDFSAVALNKARQLASLRGVDMKTELAVIETWGGSQINTMSRLRSLFSSRTPSSARSFLTASAERSLRAGCFSFKAIIQNNSSMGRAAHHAQKNMYTAHLLRNAFADLELLRLEEHNTPIVEG